MFTQKLCCFWLLAALFITIPGANSVNIGEFPYKVAILSDENELICAGTLITNDIILTAGECGNEMRLKTNIKILAGEVDLNVPEPELERRIARVNMYNEFSSYEIEHNIALIKLDSPIPSSVKYVAAPVRLAETEPDVGDLCEISSWETNEVMNNFNVKVLDHSECDLLGGFTESKDLLICTGWNDFNGYQSDVGGPLVCNGKLHGIGIRRNWVPAKYRNGGFLSISKLREWIERNIFEGRLVDEEEHPYIVNIVDNKYREKDSLKYSCAGVLISEDTVLTTAECASYDVIVDLAIVGSTHRHWYGDTEYAKEETIIEIRKHENYDNITKSNNVGLIKLNRSFPGAKFPSLKRVKSERICQAVGWGPESSSRFVYKNYNLLTVNVNLRNPEECSLKYPELNQSSIICTGDPNRKRDFCQNDFGGPLFCDGALRGIYSYGDSCSKGPEYPAVYTDVADFIDWIEGKNGSWILGGSLLYVVMALFSIYVNMLA